MTRRLIALIALLTALPAGLTTRSGAQPPPSAEIVVIKHCKVNYAQSTILGAPMVGILEECQVRLGDDVKAGDVLGRMRDGEARAQLQIRALEMKSDVDVRVNEAKYRQSLARLKVSTLLHQRNSLSLEQISLDKLEVEVAGLALEQSKERRAIARELHRQAEAVVRSHQFISPYNGVVSEIRKQPGENVSPVEPVFRIDNLDRLRIVGRLDVGDSWRVKIGHPVRASVEIGGTDLAIERERFPGKIIFVDTKIEPLTQTCIVICEVDNRDRLLRSGLESTIEIDPSKPADPPRPPAAQPPANGVKTAATAGASTRLVDGQAPKP